MNEILTSKRNADEVDIRNRIKVDFKPYEGRMAAIYHSTCSWFTNERIHVERRTKRREMHTFTCTASFSSAE